MRRAFNFTEFPFYYLNVHDFVATICSLLDFFNEIFLQYIYVTLHFVDYKSLGRWCQWMHTEFLPKVKSFFSGSAATKVQLHYDGMYVDLFPTVWYVLCLNLGLQQVLCNNANLITSFFAEWHVGIKSIHSSTTPWPVVVVMHRSRFCPSQKMESEQSHTNTKYH